MTAIVTLAVVLVLLAAYRYSLRRHPWRACRACGGRGRHHGAVWDSAWGPCRWCGGTGRQQRLGRRLSTSTRRPRRRILLDAYDDDLT